MPPAAAAHSPSRMHARSLFFFQAEHGIRVADVTGVQTCALPILGLPPAARAPRRGPGHIPAARSRYKDWHAGRSDTGGWTPWANLPPAAAGPTPAGPPRRAEIGRGSCREECRTWGGRYPVRMSKV